MISQRLRGLSQDGEAIDGLIPKLQSLFSSVGINIEDQNGELRSTFDILQDLAGVWDQLSSKQKQYFGEKVAGNRQVKTLNAIMQNWDVVADTIDKANNAQGEALKGNEMYMDSIEGRMTQLQSAFQELAKTTINSDLVKGLVSAGTEVTKFITKLGGLTPVLSAILGVVLALKGAKIVVGLKAIGAAIAGIASGATLMAGLPGILLAVASAFLMIKHNADEANSTLKQFEKAKESYEEHKTKVETLNGELRTTQERIEELEGKDSLTIIEEKELQRLKDTNGELRTQIELEEKLLEVSQTEARRKAAENIGFELNKSTTNDGVLGTGFFAEKVNIPDNILDILGPQKINEVLGYGGGESVSVFEPSKIEEIRLRMAALDEQYESLKDILDKIKSLDKDSDPEVYSALIGDQKKLEKEITENKDALLAYYDWLKNQTDGLDYVKDAKPGSSDEKFNSYLDLMSEIGNTLAYSGEKLEKTEQEIFDSIVQKYASTIDELKKKSQELGDDWQLGVPDSIKEEMKQTQEELTMQAQGILDVFDQISDEDIHNTLGDVLKKLLDTGNIEDIKRPIIDAEKMFKAGWEEFKDAIGSDSISTYYSTQYSEMVDNIPFTISVTPIKADGSVLSPEKLDDYVFKQIDKATNLEDLMENDKVENGGKGLFIHLTPAIDIDPEAAAKVEGEFGLLLHSLDGAFEQAFIEDADGGKISIAKYLDDTLTAALEDPSYTGQALTEIYTVAKTLADNGHTELQDALSQVDVPEAIRQGIGISNMDIKDLGVEHLEDLIHELMTRLGFTFEEAERALQEEINNGSEIKIGPQMSIDVGETIGKLYQTTDGYSKVLTKALSEQEKAGTLTADTIQKVLGESGLPGVAECLEQTANGYKLNTEKLNDYINAQNEDARLNAVAGIMERQIAIDNLTASLDNLADAEQYAAANDKIAQWEGEIAQLEMVANEAYNAVDALDALKQAVKTPNEDQDHTDAKDALEKTKEMYEVGKVGTDDFKSGMDFLLGEGWFERFNGDIDKAYKAWEEKRKKFFAEDDADSAVNFRKALNKKDIIGKNKETGEVELLINKATGAKWTLEEIANEFGITTEAARTLFDLINSYSYGKKITFSEDIITSADELEAAQNKLEEVKTQKEQIEKDLAEAEKEYQNAQKNGAADTEEKKNKVDELTKSLGELETQEKDLSDAIQTANDAIENGEFEQPKTLEDALEKIKEYQAAIDTLETNGITVPVELTKDKETLEKLLSNRETQLPISVTPENVDQKIDKINEFIEWVDKHPTLDSTVKITLNGLAESTLRMLQRYQIKVSNLKKEDKKTYTTTITAKANDQATVVLKGVQETAENMPDAVVEVKEDDTNNAAAVDKNVEDTFKDIYDAVVEAVSDRVQEVNDEIDAIANKKREATILVKEIELGNYIESDDNHAPTHKDVQEAVNTTKTPVGGRTDSTGTYKYIDPAQELAKIKDQYKQIYGKIPDQSEFKTAVNNLLKSGVLVLQDDVTENLDEWIAKANEIYNQNLAGIDNPDESIIQELTDSEKENLKKQIEGAFEEIPEQEVAVTANTDDIPDQVEEAVEEVPPQNVFVNVTQKFEEANVPKKLKDTTQTVNIKGNNADATKSVQGVQNEANKGATIPVDADTSEAENKNEKIKGVLEQKATKPVDLAMFGINQQIRSLEDRLSKPVKKDVIVTYKEANKKPYAKGTKRAEEGISLVDEEGAELIEHKSSGTFELGTNDGARFVHLDKGDVVHTSEETKKILSRNGSIGGFFRDGLNKLKSVIGRAFATGSGSWDDYFKPKKKKDDDDKKSGSGRTKTSGSSSHSSSTSDNSKDEMSKWTEWANKFFDWVEIKLEKLKESTKNFINEASKAIGAAAKNTYLQKAMESIKEEIDANKKAIVEYEQTAAKVAAEGGLSADITQKIKEGTIDVSRYDDEMQQKIRDYQTWYEKAQKCREAIEELEKQEKELARQRLENIDKEYSEWANKLEARQDVESAKREYNESQGIATKGDYAVLEDSVGFDLETGETRSTGDKYWAIEGNYGDYGKEIEDAKSQAEAFKNEREALAQELDSGLVEYGSETWEEYTRRMEELEAAEYKARTEAQKLIDQAKAEALKPFINAVDDMNYAEGRSKDEMELERSRGSLSRDEEVNNYNSLIGMNEEENANLAIQIELYRNLQAGLDENSEKYREYEDKIRAASDAMLANEQETEEYKERIRQLGFDKMAEDLRKLTNEADAFGDSISTKMLKGLEITKSVYEELISNAKLQIDNLNSQKAAYQALMDEMVATYGEEAKTSEKYLEYQQRVDDIDASIRGLDQSILQFEKDAENIEVEKLGWQLDAKKAQGDSLSDAINTKKIEGKEVKASDYKKLINNASGQKSILEKQNEEYRKQQEGMDKNSAAYQDLQRKIEANENAMRELDDQTLKWQKDIDNLPLEKLGNKLDRLKASGDQLSDALDMKKSTGVEVVAKDYQKLINNANAQKKNLEAQNAELEKQKQGLDVNSEEYQRIQGQIDSNNDAIRECEQSTVEWQKEMKNLPVQKLGWQLDKLKTSADKMSDALDMKKATGVKIVAKDYQKLIDNSQNQVKNLKAQNKELEKQKRGLDVNSEEYQRIQNQIDANNDTIRECEQSTVEWRKEMANLPVQKLGWQLDKLRNNADKMSDALDMKKATGVKIVAKDYQKLIDNSAKQINNLKAQNVELEKQKVGLDVNSEEYQRIQSQINANNDTIRECEKSTIEWGKAIEDLPIQELGWQLDSYKAQADEQSDAIDVKNLTGEELTSEDYQGLIDNAESQNTTLKAQNDLLAENQVDMDEESDEYQAIQRQIEANNDAIRENEKSIIQWQEAINNLSLKKLGNELNKLNTEASEFEDAISAKQPVGLQILSEDYTNLVDNAKDQITNLEDQNDILEDLMDGMDENSDKYQELKSRLDANNKSIRDLTLSTAEYEKKINDLDIQILTWKLNKAENAADAFNDALDMKNLQGKEIFASDYIKLVNNAEASIEILTDLINDYKTQLEGMDENSDAYQDTIGKIDQLEKKTRSLDAAIVQWGKDISDLPLKKLGYDLDKLNDNINSITGLKELNDAQGLEETSKYYKTIIDLGMNRIKILEEENKVLEEQQKGMDVNSDEYQKLRKQIASNNKEILDTKKNQEELNDSIIDIGIRNIQKYKESLTKSNDQLERQKQLQQAIQELEKIDGQRKVRTYVEGKGFVYQRDEDEYKNAQENLEKIIKDQLLGKLDDLIEALEDSKKDTNVYDKNGNLIGVTYNTPQLGNLSDVLAKYYKENSNATINVDVLKDAFGKGALNKLTSNNNTTTFTIGDIIVNGAKDSNALAQAIVNQLPNALLQALYQK